MFNNHFHILEEEGFAIVFYKDTLELALVPLEDRDTSHTTGVGGTLTARTSQLQDFLRDVLLKQESSLQDQVASSHPRTPVEDRPVLDRLTLTISNICNLGCSYCYAAGGTYYNVDGLMMTRETALNALNQAARVYSKIEHINFFGGEPTLNKDTIEVVCEYVRYLHAQGILSHTPSFGITTNGYSLNDRMIELLEGYGFTVTVSVDGPKEIHDLKRPTKGGKGSYEAIVKNIKLLQQHNVPVEFECTYTADHLRIGMEITSLMDFFYKEFGCRTLHCPIVSAAPDSQEFIPLDRCLKLQGDAIEYSILNLATGIPKAFSLAVRMLNSLVGGVPIWNYCPAGRTEVTVNADGKVYSCFMLMQKESYSFGSVNGAQHPSHEFQDKKKRYFPIRDQSSIAGGEKRVIEQFILDADKYTNEACKRCWAQPLCHGCLGEDFEKHKGCVKRSEVPGESEFCDYKRGIVERLLRAVARAYRVPTGYAEANGNPSTSRAQEGYQLCR